MADNPNSRRRREKGALVPVRFKITNEIVLQVVDQIDLDVTNSTQIAMQASWFGSPDQLRAMVMAQFANLI